MIEDDLTYKIIGCAMKRAMGANHNQEHDYLMESSPMDRGRLCGR